MGAWDPLGLKAPKGQGFLGASAKGSTCSQDLNVWVK